MNAKYNRYEGGKSVTMTRKGGFELDVTIVERGVTPFQWMMGNMALMKGNMALTKDSMEQHPVRNGYMKH